MLIEALGGVCVDCGTRNKLEPDHVVGCTWVQRNVTQESRLRRYAEEFRAGVPLVARCRSCNGRRNQHVHGPRSRLDDVVAEIENAERAA